MATVRKELGLNPQPERISQNKQYSNKEQVKENNGLFYSFYKKAQNSQTFFWEKDTPLVLGITDYFSFEPDLLIVEDFGMKWKGFIKIEHDDDYCFFLYSANPSKLYINDELFCKGGSYEQEESIDKTIF